MTTTQFCHWLYGFIYLDAPEHIPADKTQIIKDHLNLVFNKVTPDRGTDKVKPADVYGKPHPFGVYSNGPSGFQLEFKPNTMITC